MPTVLDQRISFIVFYFFDYSFPFQLLFIRRCCLHLLTKRLADKNEEMTKRLIRRRSLSGASGARARSRSLFYLPPISEKLSNILHNQYEKQITDHTFSIFSDRIVIDIQYWYAPVSDPALRLWKKTKILPSIKPSDVRNQMSTPRSSWHQKIKNKIEIITNGIELDEFQVYDI